MLLFAWLLVRRVVLGPTIINPKTASAFRRVMLCDLRFGHRVRPYRELPRASASPKPPTMRDDSGDMAMMSFPARIEEISTTSSEGSRSLSSEESGSFSPSESESSDDSPDYDDLAAYANEPSDCRCRGSHFAKRIPETLSAHPASGNILLSGLTQLSPEDFLMGAADDRLFFPSRARLKDLKVSRDVDSVRVLSKKLDFVVGMTNLVPLSNRAFTITVKDGLRWPCRYPLRGETVVPKRDVWRPLSHIPNKSLFNQNDVEINIFCPHMCRKGPKPRDDEDQSTDAEEGPSDNKEKSPKKRRERWASFIDMDDERIFYDRILRPSMEEVLSADLLQYFPLSLDIELANARTPSGALRFSRGYPITAEAVHSICEAMERRVSTNPE